MDLIKLWEGYNLSEEVDETSNYHHLTEEEQDLILKLYEEKGADYLLSLIPNSTYNGIVSFARRNGLKYSKGQVTWGDDEIEILERYYENTDLEELRKLLPNRSKNAIKQKAWLLDLKKERFK